MAMFNPVVTPDYLSKMGNVSPLYAIQADNAFQRAQTQDQASLADMMSGYQHEQAMRPLKQESQRLSNETSLAQLPGLRAQSSMFKRKDEMEGMTFDADVKAKLAEMASKASDNEMRQFETQVQRMMYSADPKEREKGFKLFEASKHMYEVRQKQKFDAEENQKQRAAQLEAARIGAASRESVAAAKAGAGNKPAKTPRELSTLYMQLAAQASTPEEQQYYTTLADQAWQKAIEEAVIKAGASQAGKPNIGELAGVPTNAMPQPAPVQLPPAKPGAAPKPAQAKVFTMDQLKQRYPNATEQQIRDAAKAKGIEIR